MAEAATDSQPVPVAPGTGPVAVPVAVNDLWPRLLLSPIIGWALPNLCGLIDNSRHTPAGLIGSYIYFAFTAFTIWEGNRRLYFRMQRREDWLKRPLRRLAALLTTILLYSIPCVAILVSIWRYVTGDPGTNAYAVPMALLATVTVVVIITHVYETVFLLRDWESDRLRSALNDQARLRAELEALGREVAPHFLFNNLHALSHLIEGKGATASAFIQALSATYRYVLDARGRTLVPLAEELEALGHFETLAAIRFSGGAQLNVDVDRDAAERLLLPPVTLSELFHNALKHNAADPASPLTVGVRLEDQTLMFENVCRACDERGPSTGVGLDNLRRRFELATGRSVTWGKVNDRFVVTLPLVASPALPTSSASPFRPSPDSSS